jgi:7-carboxy-7-deazaguanine synthase
MIAIARQGVYRSVQGEGALLGEPTTFVRLAGCSVGCAGCDTDYRPHRGATEAEVVAEVLAVAGTARWAWITGGEPTDQHIAPLVAALRDAGLLVAVATAGVRPCPPCDWVSVSPHAPGRPAQWHGHEVKLVSGLNGLDLDACDPRDYPAFPHRYVVPCAGKAGELEKCRAWVDRHPGWRLGVQAHKLWRLA